MSDDIGMPGGCLRDHPNHRERGPMRFSYTYADIARAAGVSARTARNAACGDQPELDPQSLKSVVDYVMSRAGRRYRRGAALDSGGPTRRPGR